MEGRTSTPTPPAPPGAAPTTHPPMTGSEPSPRTATDVLDTAESPPTAKDEPGESAHLAPEDDEALGDRVAEDVFGSEDNARNTAGLVTSFVSSWERHKHEKTPAAWLTDEFRRYPELWTGDEEIVSTANEVVSGVEQANADKASLHAHLDAGKSKESWLAGKIEQGAAAAGVTNAAEKAAEKAADLQQAFETENEQMRTTIMRENDPSNVVKESLNLDGSIAEQEHASTFNLDAIAKDSDLRAKVVRSHGKNSVDIVVQDNYGNGKIRDRFQLKYGKHSDATRKLYEKGDYSGQKLVVPSGQEGDIPGSTDRIEVDGVRSKPLAKDVAKRQQEQVQQGKEPRKYEWNDVNRIEIAKSIGKQALVGAGLACGLQGARILGRRAWNFLRGRENPPASEDLREFFVSSVKSAGHVGAQTAVSGAVVVAARNGCINALKHTPPGRIVGIVHVGMENAKVLFKYAKGELNGMEALDAVGKCTTSAVGGLAGAVKGAPVGAKLGAVFGPAGAMVGGFVGGVVGYMAGSKFGEAVYKFPKRARKRVRKFGKKVKKRLRKMIR